MQLGIKWATRRGGWVHIAGRVLCFVCEGLVGTVCAPVIREEADFGLPSREDTLQAGLLWRVAHVLQHPLQKLQDKTDSGSRPGSLGRVPLHTLWPTQVQMPAAGEVLLLH